MSMARQVKQLEIGALVTIRGLGRIKMVNLTQVNILDIFGTFS